MDIFKDKTIIMKKNKKCKISLFSPFWWTTLFIGISIGILSQQIPELRSYTKEILYSEEHHDNYKHLQENSLPKQPISSFLIHRPGYSLAYDARNKNPLWVYEHLTAENIKGNTDRSHSDFKEDETIPQHLRATLSDYKGQGFDRGHMAPAADHKSQPQAMSDTFFMTNMCPQCPQFNRGYWAKLEKHVRDLTKTYQNVYVITGPLYIPHDESDGRYVKYKVIGSNDVSVPTHFFKIIKAENNNGKIETCAYILPNQEIQSHIPIEKFQTTIKNIEKLAGILLNN
jgi:endonuclease G